MNDAIFVVGVDIGRGSVIVTSTLCEAFLSAGSGAGF